MKQQSVLLAYKKQLGINDYIAIKTQYNNCVGCNDFYKMLKRRITLSNVKDSAAFHLQELNIHWKEYVQYQ